MPSTHNHDCHPIWISQLGPVATCNAHWWKPRRPHPEPDAGTPINAPGGILAVDGPR